jgi:hypothetical protein
VDAIERQDDHHDEIGDEQRDVEGIPAVFAAKGAVEQMRSNVVLEAMPGGEQEREGVEMSRQRRLSREVRRYLEILREGLGPKR